MTVTADFVVAGGGHNSLITAAYLARAGHEVVVLDARPIIGGGAATEELLVPGFRFDSCSTGHTLIQANPLLTADELGLLGEYGLEYAMPDPVAHVVFPDGRSITTWLDFERTVEGIARFSRTDAETYRRLMEEYASLAPIFSAANFTPPGYGKPVATALEEHPRGGTWMRRRLMTAADVIDREFENRHVKAFLAWQAFQTAQPIDAGATGLLATSIQAGRQKRSWTIPLGGSGSLPEALARCLADDGATILCDKRVTELVLEGGRCAGVETDDGERYMARKAVVSTIHVRHLTEMAPRSAWDEDWLYGIKTYDVGLSAFAVYLATSTAPVFETEDASQAAVSAGTVGWLEDVVGYGRDLKDGKFVTGVPWILVATPSLVDPARAPDGHHTVKLLSMQRPDPPEGQDWAEAKEEHALRQLEHLRRWVPGLAEESIVARLVKCPRDIERGNPQMVDGAFHGGERGIAQIGPLRPAPRWGQHRTPIPGLYQTGATTHPGGSITGAPGRNAATVILADHGSSLEEVVANGRTAVAG